MPDGYRISLSEGPDFDDTSLNGEVIGGGTTTFIPPLLLNPATQYYWYVQAEVEETIGDFGIIGSFFTGPECSPLVGVEAPVITSPENGEIVDTLTPNLRYRPGVPGCIPDGYLINLQTDPGFTGTNLSTEIGFPANYLLANPLADCTLHFMKVSTIQDLIPGPVSDVNWFYTNAAGDCPPPPVPGVATKNIFCRDCTYPEYCPDPRYLFMEGDYLQIIARNPLTTYVKVIIPVEGEPKPVQYESCWTPINAIQYRGNLDQTMVEKPPSTPVPDSPIAVPDSPICHSLLKTNECLAAGGIPAYTHLQCTCP